MRWSKNKIFQKRLSSFTVIELMVVVTISAILMVAVFYSFHYFNRLYHSFSKKMNRTENSYGFEKQLRKDFREASYVEEEGNSLKMVYPHKAVWYTFYRDYALREQAYRKDTVEWGLVRFDVEETENREKERLVKVMIASFLEGEEELKIYLAREYTPEMLLKSINEQSWQD